jgi:hypothetical protein
MHIPDHESSPSARIADEGLLTCKRKKFATHRNQADHMEKSFKNQGKRQLLEDGVRLRYFFILLLRPTTRFFSNRLKIKMDVSPADGLTKFYP